MQTVATHAAAGDINVVSFEDYDLGSQANLMPNGFSQIHPQLIQLGLTPIPMITTANINKMHTLFANPDGFIDSVVQECKKNGFPEANIDFEPETGVVTDDGVAYAQFLTHFADEMHKAGLTLSVDIASWGPLWDFGLLANTTVDKFMTMDTYANSQTYFQSHLEKAVDAFGVGRVGVGLLMGMSLNSTIWEQRLASLDAAQVREVDLWDICNSAPTGIEWDYVSRWMHGH
eukprot:GAFH01002511.1.p1 GENE.GAFH01002511.1~~GAFH01002511.1.p1  ORF type:complete len:270 (-),score=50.80 GAFH01002511.1:344-1036(-)